MGRIERVVVMLVLNGRRAGLLSAIVEKGTVENRLIETLGVVEFDINVAELNLVANELVPLFAFAANTGEKFVRVRVQAPRACILL